MPVDVAIVGGGVAGLSVAFELRRRLPTAAVTVLEACAAPGGKVRSSHEGHMTFDWGPNGFAPAPTTLELVRRLGLEDRLLPAADGSMRRYLFRDGALRAVPGKPQQFLASELLSPLGKLRLLAEPFVPRGGTREETLSGFVSRRLGSGAAWLAETMVLGVTAGDARELSLDALFPQMRKMELEHGSLLRAARTRPRRPPGPPLFSFPEGMGELTAALARALDGSVRLHSKAVFLTAVPEGGYRLRLEDGSELEANKLVLATPAPVTAELLEPLLPEAAQALRQIPYPPVDVFAVMFDRIDVPHPLDGFGFLVPRGEGVRLLGVLWSSSLYPGRAPAGKVLLRVIAGGAVDPGFPSLSDEEALAAVRRDLRLALGVVAEPLEWHRIRHELGIPQYTLGHRERVATAMTQARTRGGLALAGNAYYGVGVNDCVRDASRVVDELVAS